MLTPKDVTPDGLLDYAENLMDRDAPTLTDDQLRVLLLTKIVAELGVKIQQIQEILSDDRRDSLRPEG